MLLAKAPVLGFELPTNVGERKINCRRYEMCLTYAMAQDWYGFHCERCPVEDEYTQAELLERSAGAFSGDPESLFEALGTSEPEDEQVSEKAELTLDEAAEFLATSKNWCVRLAKKGAIKMRKDGDAVLFDREALEVFKAAKAGEKPGRGRKASPAPAPTVDVRPMVRWVLDGVGLGIFTADAALAKIGEVVG